MHIGSVSSSPYPAPPWYCSALVWQPCFAALWQPLYSSDLYYSSHSEAPALSSLNMESQADSEWLPKAGGGVFQRWEGRAAMCLIGANWNPCRTVSGPQMISVLHYYCDQLAGPQLDCIVIGAGFQHFRILLSSGAERPVLFLGYLEL